MTFISVSKRKLWLDEELRDHPQVTTGRYVYKAGRLTIRLFGPDASVSIGSFATFASDIAVYGGGNHRVDWATTFLLRSTWGLPGESDVAPARPTQIGNDVWLGDGVSVLGGASIGDGCVVGAASVVRGDLPPYSIALGNPATVVRPRFRADTVARLLELRWWEWPLERVLYNADLLCSDPDGWPDDLEFADPPPGYRAPPRSAYFGSGPWRLRARSLRRAAALGAPAALIGARSRSAR